MRVRPWLPAFLGALPLTALLLVSVPEQVSRLSDPCMEWGLEDRLAPSSPGCPGGTRGNGLTYEEAWTRFLVIHVATLVALVVGVLASWKEKQRLVLLTVFVLLLESVPFLMSGAALFHWFAAAMFMVATRLVSMPDHWSVHVRLAFGWAAMVGFVALLVRMSASVSGEDVGNVFSIVLVALMLGTLAFVAGAGLWPVAHPSAQPRP